MSVWTSLQSRRPPLSGSKRLVLSLLTALFAGLGCTAPPPLKTEDEVRRPLDDERSYDALIIDYRGRSTWVDDLRFRGASEVFSDDSWRFVEFKDKNDKVQSLSFKKLQRFVMLGWSSDGKKLKLEAVLRTGERYQGFVTRRAYLEGQSEFGAATIKLKYVRQVSFGMSHSGETGAEEGPSAQ